MKPDEVMVERMVRVERMVAASEEERIYELEKRLAELERKLDRLATRLGDEAMARGLAR